MNPPTPTTRLIGTPRVANTLYVCYAVLVVGCLAGELPWWVALVALFAAGGTRDAVRRVRSYKGYGQDTGKIGT
jgi:hypothetical protein